MSLEEYRADGARPGVERLLDVACRQLNLDVAYVTRFDRGHGTIAAAVGEHAGVEVGRIDRLDDACCHRSADGRVGAAVPRARGEFGANPAGARALPVRAHVGVPVTLSDGSLYGTLCAFRTVPDAGTTPPDARVLRVIAQAVAALLEPGEMRRRSLAAQQEQVRRLLAARDPHIVLQPIRRLRDGTTVAAEALSRFRSVPGRDPVEVFAMADDAGLGLAVERAALDAACGTASASPVPVTINGSAALWLDPGARSLLGGCPPDRVIVEITERHPIADYRALNAALEPHRAAGVRVAVDDVGSGFAGLQHVLELRPDFIKLDATLVSGIDVDTWRQAMACALVAFAARTGAQVIAEGIEAPGELDALVDLGVPFGQGWLLGRPACAAAGAAR